MIIKYKSLSHLNSVFSEDGNSLEAEVEVVGEEVEGVAEEGVVEVVARKEQMSPLRILMRSWMPTTTRYVYSWNISYKSRRDPEKWTDGFEKTCRIQYILFRNNPHDIFSGYTSFKTFLEGQCYYSFLFS